MAEGSERSGWKLVAGMVLATSTAAARSEAQTPPAPVSAAPPAARSTATAPTATATATAAVPAMSADQIVRLSTADLERIYRGATPGAVPRGRVHGIPIVAPGRSYAPAASRMGRLVWQGKVFDPEGNAAVNRFFGVRAVRGVLSYGPSWLDGRPALILDYQGTSLVYARYRDEIREVAPGLYLGVMFARTEPQPTFTRFFAFEARP
jgi:hypothetical protein